MMIAIMNTAIIWGDYIVTDLFNVNEMSEPPDEAVYNKGGQSVANGTFTKVYSSNTENTFSIKIARATAKEENIKLFKQLFEDDKTFRMRVVNLTTGEVLLNYNTAYLANTKFAMSGLSDGQPVYTTMTWTVTNARG